MVEDVGDGTSQGARGQVAGAHALQGTADASQDGNWLATADGFAQVGSGAGVAQAAFDEGGWSGEGNMLKRVRVLNKIAELLRENNEALARMEVEQIGRPLREMQFSCSGCRSGSSTSRPCCGSARAA